MKEVLLAVSGLVIYVIYMLVIITLWHYSMPMAIILIGITALTVFILVLKYMESNF